MFSSRQARAASPSDELKNTANSRKGGRKPASEPSVRGEPRHASSGDATAGMFALDTDLDHMEGIVNPSFVGPSSSQPTTPGAVTGGGIGGGEHAHAHASSGSSSSMDSRNGGAWADAVPSPQSSIGSSYLASSMGRRPTQATGQDASSISPFNTRDPFATVGVNATAGASPRTPPSPHTTQNNGKPVTTLFHSTQPRRPSHLRNVNSPTDESPNPFDSFPSGSSAPFGQEFSNPFAGGTIATSSSAAQAARANHLWEVDPTAQTPFDPAAILGALSPRSQPGAVAPPILPAGGAFNAAWVAPESWGVEGDQEDDEDDSTDEEGDGPSVGILDILSGAKKSKTARAASDVKEAGGLGQEVDGEIVGSGRGSLAGPRSLTGGSASGKRPGTSSTRPGTANRPGTSGGRIGTSASAQPGPTVCIPCVRPEMKLDPAASADLVFFSLVPARTICACTRTTGRTARSSASSPRRRPTLSTS